jgi:hypothetical protein
MKLLNLLLLAVVPLVLLPYSASGTSGPVEELRFRVFLDDEPIGSHNVRIAEKDSTRTVESEASFDVRLLFVPVFSYRHSNTEIWRDGCLLQIDAQTDSNGKQYRVEGRKRGSAYRIGTDSATEAYPVNCLMSFAYWDRQMLQQERLLNAQTGEIVQVDIEPLGEKTLRLGDREIAADGYRIVARDRDVDIKVWYSRRDGSWLSLESRLKNGRLMRYLPAGTDLLASIGADEGNGGPKGGR